jgi:putative oxidoreductase
MSISSLTLKTTALAEKAFAPFGNVVLLVLRLVWGWQFLTTGLGKLQNHERVTGFFTSLGIPAPGLNAWFIGGLELVGGALLLLHDLDTFLRADAFWFLFVSVVVLTLGPGALSLDRLLAKRFSPFRAPRA